MDERGQRLALDELHRVVVHAPLAADREDRHDVGVVQLRGGLGLYLEPPQLMGVERRGEGQHLQRHPAAERDLLGLEDDPHRAPAYHPADAEVAQAGVDGRLDVGVGIGSGLDPAGHPQYRQAGP